MCVFAPSFCHSAVTILSVFCPCFVPVLFRFLLAFRWPFASPVLTIQEVCQTGISNGWVPAAAAALVRVEAFHLAVVGAGVDLKAGIEGVQHLSRGTAVVGAAAEPGVVASLHAWAGVALPDFAARYDAGAVDPLAAHAQMVGAFLRIG